VSYASTVTLPDGTTAVGEGPSKKKAQEEAASKALEHIE
jgi:dsRNA-specific ribonuclease